MIGCWLIISNRARVFHDLFHLIYTQVFLFVLGPYVSLSIQGHIVLCDGAFTLYIHWKLTSPRNPSMGKASIAWSFSVWMSNQIALVHAGRHFSGPMGTAAFNVYTTLATHRCWWCRLTVVTCGAVNSGTLCYPTLTTLRIDLVTLNSISNYFFSVECIKLYKCSI